MCLSWWFWFTSDTITLKVLSWTLWRKHSTQEEAVLLIHSPLVSIRDLLEVTFKILAGALRVSPQLFFPDLRDLRWLQIHARLKRCIMHNKTNKSALSAKNSKTNTVNNGGVRAVRGRPRHPRLQGCQKTCFQEGWASVAYYYSNRKTWLLQSAFGLSGRQRIGRGAPARQPCRAVLVLLMRAAGHAGCQAACPTSTHPGCHRATQAAWRSAKNTNRVTGWGVRRLIHLITAAQTLYHFTGGI